MQDRREGPYAPCPGPACWGLPTGARLPGSALPGREGKGHVLSLPHPADKSPRHPATLSVQDSQGSPESPAAGALGAIQTEPSLDQVLQERDEAIAKKRAVEAELDTCKARLRAVEAQLLEVLEEKLRLRQEVEAWEEDMQQLVRQQVQSQLEREARDAQGAHGDPGAARSPWARLGRWW
ncbi:BICD family-like cargo adapter 1 [Ictidomys tridecemlineatus]|uniref:BICD family-like cargo adapter 1 n=1 Tax=Ictidomys tridecemlineatus TaxID=43179 RepID=UPI000682B3F8|nr:BICD family-like cargo adapter 1 [Ictidomys tridecemlineatus]KAG3259798.1 BICD family-like cargo adapter 1, transcript variant X2 [Ictidomys tridecemlineatus]